MSTRSRRRASAARQATSSLLEQRSRSPSSGRGEHEGASSSDPPAWAQQLIRQVAQLKEATATAGRQDVAPGEASDTDTELSRPAHKDQYTHNKKVASYFAAIQANPSRAVELAKKGEELARERNKIVRIADVDGWDTVRFFAQKPLVDSESEKRRLKEAREQALSMRRANANSGRSRRSREREQAQRRERRSVSQSPSPKRSWRREKHQFTTDARDRTAHNFRSSARPEREAPVCFECGKSGHFRRYCPELGDAARNGGGGPIASGARQA